MAKKINDLDPDGVRIVVPWEELHVGGSFFIPCVNVGECAKQVDDVAKRLGIGLTPRQRVEYHRLGLRIWRTA